MKNALAGLGLLALSCAAPAPSAPSMPTSPATPPAVSPTHYADASAWLCLPGRDDACARDLTATVFHADGSRTVERSEPARDAKADCFYVYPTVDLSPTPGNHEDFGDLEPMTAAVTSQAARLRQTCAIYAPLYRQVTIGSYFHPESLEPRLAFAYSDVEAAFRTYLEKYNHGRPIVLIGHSQGADMVIRLLQHVFDHDADLRARLVLALPVGWFVEVPRGKAVGATLENIPMCTTPEQSGCVISYRSYEAGGDVHPRDHAPRDGDVPVCVNPAAVGSDALTTFSRTYLRLTPASRRDYHLDGIDTPFVELDGFFQGQCVDGPGGARALAISTVPGDPRKNPIDYAKLPLHKYIGLHVLDLQLPQGDIVDLVSRHVAQLH